MIFKQCIYIQIILKNIYIWIMLFKYLIYVRRLICEQFIIIIFIRNNLDIVNKFDGCIYSSPLIINHKIDILNNFSTKQKCMQMWTTRPHEMQEQASIVKHVTSKSACLVNTRTRLNFSTAYLINHIMNLLKRGGNQ